MRWLYIGISMAAAMFLDTVVFAGFDLFGAVPDCMLVVIVSVGVLVGSGEAAAAGCAAGLFLDVLFGRAVGINALAYMLSGVMGGVFYKKYYADNLVIPVLTAALCSLFKEHLMALMTKLLGGGFSYFGMLARYILPSAVLSAALCFPVHALLKPMLLRAEKKRYDRSAGGIK